MKTLMIAMVLSISAAWAQTNLVKIKTIEGKVGQIFTAGAATKNKAEVTQWYKDGKPIPGATNSLLEFIVRSKNDAGLYSVVATNATRVSKDAVRLRIVE